MTSTRLEIKSHFGPGNKSLDSDGVVGSRLAMGLRIRQLQTADDDGFDVLTAVYRADLAERDPEDPPFSDRLIATEMFGLPADRVRLVFSADIDGEPAGFALASFHRDSEAEVRLAEVEISVIDGFRRRGVASGLMESVVPALVEADQNSVIAYTCVDLWAEEGVGLCTKYGLTKRQEERCSRAKVAEIDDDLMQHWIDAAATKAVGYRIEQWEGPCPDHLLEAWCVAAAGMEDAPLDGVDFKPVTRSVEAQRAADIAFAERGYRLYRTLALSSEGEPAGLTALFVPDGYPHVGYQDDTAVLTAHRGHGIGRWLKAANYQQTLRAQPELSVIETYNAQSNPWMLDINIAMAFKPHHIYDAYQGPIETVVEAMNA